MAPKRKILETAPPPLPMPSGEAAAASPQVEPEGTPLVPLAIMCLTREMVQVPDMVQAQVTPSSSPPLLVASGELARVAAKQRAKAKVVKHDRIKGFLQWMRVEILVHATHFSAPLPAYTMHLRYTFRVDRLTVGRRGRYLS